MPVENVYYHKPFRPKTMEDLRDQVIRVMNKGFRMCHIPKQIISHSEMNPFQIWYYTNQELQAFIESYYKQNLNLIKDASLRESVEKTYLQGSAKDRLQAINLLAVFKRYFI